MKIKLGCKKVDSDGIYNQMMSPFTSLLLLWWFSILNLSMTSRISLCKLWCSRHCSPRELHQSRMPTLWELLPLPHVAHLKRRSRCQWSDATADIHIPNQAVLFQPHDYSMFLTSDHPTPRSCSRESDVSKAVSHLSFRRNDLFFLTSGSFPK